jgi:hypothetical protein
MGVPLAMCLLMCEYAWVMVGGEVMCGRGLGICCISGVVLMGVLCSLRSMVRHRGSSLLVISWLHFCGIGLYAIMNAYSRWFVGYVARSEVCLLRWVRFGGWLFGGVWVRCGANFSTRCI